MSDNNNTIEDPTPEQNDHPNYDEWFFHRRIGYYVSMFWSIILTLIYLGLITFMDVNFDDLGSIVMWSYLIPGALSIISYYGNTAYFDKLLSMIKSKFR